jgi:hypothetical protein
MHTRGFRYVNLKEAYHLEHLCTSEDDIKVNLKEIK